MATSTSKCRGFTHPVLLLIRSSSRSPTLQHSIYTSKLGLQSCLRSTTSQRSLRLFAAGTRQHLQVTAAKAELNPVTRTTAKAISPSVRPAVSSSYAQALARRPGGAVLYEGAEQKVFIVSSYLAGFVCMGGAAANVFFNVYNVPSGVPEWTAYAFGSVALMLAILGMNFALKPANIVRRIRILPAVEAASKTTGGYSAPTKVQIEVLSRSLSPIPGIPLKKEIVGLSDIVLKASMYNPEPFGVGPRPTMETVDYDEKHPQTTSSHGLRWVISNFFLSLRRGLTGEGFAPIEVNGQRLKLDITNAYVLEEGRAMDRILKLEKDNDMAPFFRKA